MIGFASDTSDRCLRHVKRETQLKGIPAKSWSVADILRSNRYHRNRLWRGDSVSIGVYQPVEGEWASPANCLQTPAVAFRDRLHFGESGCFMANRSPLPIQSEFPTFVMALGVFDGD